MGGRGACAPAIHLLDELVIVESTRLHALLALAPTSLTGALALTAGLPRLTQLTVLHTMLSMLPMLSMLTESHLHSLTLHHLQYASVDFFVVQHQDPHVLLHLLRGVRVPHQLRYQFLQSLHHLVPSIILLLDLLEFLINVPQVSIHSP